MINNKRGSMESIIVILLIIGITSVIITAGYKAFDDTFDVLQPQIDSSSVANYTITQARSALEIFDTMILGILIALIIGVILLSFMIDVHPIFFVTAVILAIFSIVLSVILSNMYITAVAELGVASSFTITTFVFQYLPYIVALINMMAMIVIYAGKKIVAGGGL